VGCDFALHLALGRRAEEVRNTVEESAHNGLVGEQLVDEA
jgi:hypothetical protein